MGHLADWFVGGIAIILGLVAIWSAATPESKAFQLTKLRWFEQLYGRQAARMLLAILGCLLIAGGVAIALGFKWTLLES
ncbi:MAG TPA: hypothetical protein VL096_22330 [Pirellulaceae bacterium]|nr:hypothetical protein [Pirellulaceae bacterium]